MISRLINIGNSKGIRIPKKLIKKYELGEEIEIKLINGDLLLCKKEGGRTNWDEQIKSAIAGGDLTERDPFKNINNEWDSTEWTWPE